MFFSFKGSSIDRPKYNYSMDLNGDTDTANIISQQGKLIDDLMNTNRELIERVSI